MHPTERITATALALQAESFDPLCAYIYDLEALRVHAAGLMAKLPANCEIFYAVKANAELPILQTLAGQVHGFEVASGGELQWVRQQFPQTPIIFGGPGKLESELAAALSAGVELIHVESRLELQRLARIAQASGRRADILLRINLALEELPSTSLTMGGRPTPFGLDASELEDTLIWLQEKPSLHLRGFHFHLLSHQLDAQAQLRLLRGYFRQVKMWQAQYDLNIRHLNVGGGIGINYREPEHQFDWEGFCSGLQELLREEAMTDWCIRFECGRYITAACGYYVMEVLDIKRNHGRHFAVARGGTHHFRTPAAQGHNHPFTVLPSAHRRDEVAPELSDAPVTVVGQLCTPKDVLASEVRVEHLRVGDLLLFSYAGAYAWNISHHDFLRHPKPKMLFLEASAAEA